MQLAADSLADALDALSVAPLTIDSTDDQLRLIVECVPRQQLASLRRVCKTWRRVLDADEQLWERACREEWSLRWWWAWGFATRPSTWRAWWLEGREVQLPARALTDAEWWETQPHAALLHCMCFGFQDPELLRTFISANGRRTGWLQIMREHEFDYDEDDLRTLPQLDDRVPGPVLMWISLALLSMRRAAGAEHIFGLYAQEDKYRRDEFFAAPVFESRLTSDDVYNVAHNSMATWLARWQLILGSLGSTMLGHRLYLAAGRGELPELDRQRPYAAEIHLPPYRPWHLRSANAPINISSGTGLRDFIATGVVVMAAPHAGRTGLLLTSSFSYPVPADLTKRLPDLDVTAEAAMVEVAWDQIRADCIHLGLPAGFELSEVERGSTECLRAAEESLSRWKLLRKMGARSFQANDLGLEGQVLAATWIFALGFFNLMCPDDGRAQDLHDNFYE